MDLNKRRYAVLLQETGTYIFDLRDGTQQIFGHDMPVKQLQGARLPQDDVAARLNEYTDAIRRVEKQKQGDNPNLFESFPLLADRIKTKRDFVRNNMNRLYNRYIGG